MSLSRPALRAVSWLERLGAIDAATWRAGVPERVRVELRTAGCVEEAPLVVWPVETEYSYLLEAEPLPLAVLGVQVPRKPVHR